MLEDQTEQREQKSEGVSAKESMELEEPVEVEEPHPTGEFVLPEEENNPEL